MLVKHVPKSEFVRLRSVMTRPDELRLLAQSVAGRSSAFGELRMWDEHIRCVQLCLGLSFFT